MDSSQSLSLFFPLHDRVLVIGARGVAAVSYSSLRLKAHPTRFVESDSVPTDAQIVYHRWRFVNKNGTPDRRFNNNRQIPVAQYEELSIQTASGANEFFHVSRVGAAAGFILAIDSYRWSVPGGLALALRRKVADDVGEWRPATSWSVSSCARSPSMEHCWHRYRMVQRLRASRSARLSSSIPWLQRRLHDERILPFVVSHP
jgi:hypothetical protein